MLRAADSHLAYDREGYLWNTLKLIKCRIKKFSKEEQMQTLKDVTGFH